jgi:hypothetical protein
MKKQILSEEFQRMQKLAGIINEENDPFGVAEKDPTHRLVRNVYYIEEDSELRDYDEDFYDEYSGSAVSKTKFIDDGVDEDYIEELMSEGFLSVYMDEGDEGWMDEYNHFESVTGSDAQVENEDVESIN